MLELLIDADSAIYKAGCANEERSYHIIDDDDGSIVAQRKYLKEAQGLVSTLGDGAFSIVKYKEAGPLAHALSNAKRVMQNATALSHTDRQVFISGKGNFRYDIYPCYKGNRDGGDKPIQEQEIRNYLIKHWGAQCVDGEEVDDRVSYLQCLSEPKSTCIVSIDKDLLNTPGYNFNYDKQELKWVTQEQADLTFYRQLLTGDSTDNIPGVRGLGVKTAHKLLPEWTPHLETDVAVVYQDRYGDNWKEVMEMNGILLWMRREPDEMWSVTV